jgi:predicted restriction endonuclease
MNTNCAACGSPLCKMESELKKSKTGNVFCNRSCAATFNNKTPKRLAKSKCLICSKTVNPRSQYCNSCYKDRFFLDNKTLEEATANRKDSNRYCSIRQHARREYLRSEKPKECVICGYQLHIEVCHIKDIAEFSLDSKINVVNSLNNLTALCPTHHWEFDNGLIKIDQVGIEPTVPVL